ncbi:MAG TPA: HEAT repeat domain-containing protein [Gemmataceae bacterium]|nr:HEAT repeat domain-containing protein [Gemmataceae bacterium]
MLAIVVVMLSLPGAARTQGPSVDPVERLRRSLQATYPDAATRDRAVKRCLGGLRSLADLQRAVMLVEWQDCCPDDADAAVDRVNRAVVVEWFRDAVRRVLHHGDPSAVAQTIDRLAELAALAHANGEPTTLAGRFQSDLADLTIQGSPQVRGVAAHTLAQIEPSVYIAVPALGELLQAGDGEQRLAAADGFACLLQNASQAVDLGGRVTQRPAPRSELVLVASSVLPAVHHGLDDTQPAVRHRCLETIGLAAAALSRLVEDILPSEDSGSAVRPITAKREELRSLMQAFRDQGPILVRLLRDDDAQVRILTHRALEELGHAYWRWVQRCAAADIALEEAEDALRREVLQEALPGLAAALSHPDMHVRRSALDALEMFGPLALPALPAMVHALRDPDLFSRWSAVRTVGKLGSSAAPLAAQDLNRLLHDPDLNVRSAAATALARLNARRFVTPDSR